jgi:hypothetical protein
VVELRAEDAANAGSDLERAALAPGFPAIGPGLRSRRSRLFGPSTRRPRVATLSPAMRTRRLKRRQAGMKLIAAIVRPEKLDELILTLIVPGSR